MIPTRLNQKFGHGVFAAFKFTDDAVDAIIVPPGEIPNVDVIDIHNGRVVLPESCGMINSRVSDWRLPTIAEVIAITHMQEKYPTPELYFVSLLSTWVPLDQTSSFGVLRVNPITVRVAYTPSEWGTNFMLTVRTVRVVS